MSTTINIIPSIDRLETALTELHGAGCALDMMCDTPNLDPMQRAALLTIARNVLAQSEIITDCVEAVGDDVLTASRAPLVKGK